MSDYIAKIIYWHQLPSFCWKPLSQGPISVTGELPSNKSSSDVKQKTNKLDLDTNRNMMII